MSTRFSGPAIQVRDLQCNFGAVKAVRGIDLTVHGGELFGLIGPDGAGKTATISCLAGLMRPSSGKVQILGEDPMARGSMVRERLGLMPQQYSLYGDLSVAENLSFFGRLFGLPRAVFEERRRRLLDITRLSRFEDRRASALSGGMYKKLALSCALLHTPDVLILDEPTNGVDPVSRRELWELIYELISDGMTVLVSTPYMDEAARCHRVALMYDGEIVAEGSPTALAAALEHDVYEVFAPDLEPVRAWLGQSPAIIASSPAGSRVRIVTAVESRASLEDSMRSLGATMKRTAPSFEDLFLSRMGSRRAEAENEAVQAS